MNDRQSLSEGARDWIKKLESKTDQMYEIVIRLDEKFNRQTETENEVKDIAGRVDKLESRADRTDGKMSAYVWVGRVLVGLGVVAQAIAAYVLFFMK